MTQAGTTKTIQHPGVAGALAGDRRRRSRHRVPALTILFHPNGERVGERALLEKITMGLSATLSRLEPNFVPAQGGAPRPLNDPFLSRTPLRLTGDTSGAIHLDLGGCPLTVRVNGEAVAYDLRISAGAVRRGAVVELGNRIVLLLHTWSAAEPGTDSDEDHLGLVGASEGIERVRTEVRRVADLEVPVLLRGETGTGKELVASALHRASRRAEKPMLSLNLGAVPGQLAASELFGAVKGSFTGAAGSVGHFQRAHGGTLFLDEIGEAPAEVQVLLLRALETGEIQKVGGGDPFKVDVRLLAATDADLEEAIEEGRFRAPLLHRLAGYTVHIPPLRERRDDIGRLLYHFLREELAKLGEEERLITDERQPDPWLPASIVARLARHPWPGNVRQLRNVVRQLAIASRGAPSVVVPVEVDRMLREAGDRDMTVTGEGIPASTAPDDPSQPDPAPASPVDSLPRRQYRKPSEVSPKELLSALKANRWELKATAATLGISRPSLYTLIDKHPDIRKASELSAAEIRAAAESHDDFLPAMAEALEVSESGLRQRMRDLEID